MKGLMYEYSEYIEAVVRGERYIGHFKARKHQALLDRSTEHCKLETVDYWYEGTGAVQCIGKKSQKYFFLETEKISVEDDPNQNSCENELEKSIIRILNPEELPLAVSKEKYPCVIDIALENMLSAAKSSSDRFPLVTPPRLNLGHLDSLGYCTRKDGQLIFTFDN